MGVLKYAKQVNPELVTKTSLMLGLGETDDEIAEALTDLRKNEVDVVSRYYTPEEFQHWQEVAESMGFKYVASGPLVRSSYKAGELFLKGYIEEKNSAKAAAVRNAKI
eukprot:GSChrysophyteH1.ASY1.ANO1.2434.1 assembled CDS